MLKIRIIQPDHDVVYVEVDQDEAVIGRSASCDVVVKQPQVSKRHVRVLAGLVAIDQGSSNGTFISGKKLSEASLLKNPRIQLGSEDGDTCIEVEHVAEGADDLPAVQEVRKELDQERFRSTTLSARVRELESAAEGAVGDPETLPVVVGLRTANADLEKRIRSLKQEVESRDVEGSADLQARLAGDAMSQVQKRNDELHRRVAELEGQAGTPELEAAKQVLSGRVAELEGDRAELEETIRRLRKDLEDAAAKESEPAPAASDLFFKLQAENSQLRKDLEGASKSPEGGSSEVFFKLQAEKADLQRKLDALESGAGSAPAAVPGSGAGGDVSGELAALKKANHELEMSKVDLVGELSLLRDKLQTASLPGAAPTASASSNLGGALRSAQAFIQSGMEGRGDIQGPANEFLMVESLRYLRVSEKVVTRMAGKFIQLFEQHTMLPDVDGSVKDIVSGILADDTYPEVRREFVEYVDELGKWLVVALGASRRAAERFAEQLRSDLSERSLTADEPIPKLKKLSGQADAELWSRASAYLRRLTADIVEDRLEDLTRECAAEILKDQSR